MRSLAGILAQLPTYAIESIEAASHIALGKGWGATTVRQEVAECLGQVSAYFSGAAEEEGPLVALDIGANKGAWTEALLECVPDAEIVCFEPSLEAFEELSRKYSRQPNVRLVRAAVGSSHGTATLWADTPGSGLASLTKRRLHHYGVEFDFSEDVDVLTLDEWCERNKVFPTLIKIDVEGHELDVLKGALRMIKRSKVVQFEFGGANIDTKTFFQDFWYFFKEVGFELRRIAPGGLIEIRKYREIDEHFRVTNFIAVAASEKAQRN